MAIRIRIILLLAVALLAALVAPSFAAEAVAPHVLDLERSVAPDGIVIQDLSGGVGSQDASGTVLQIVQVQPSAANGVSAGSEPPLPMGMEALITS